MIAKLPRLLCLALVALILPAHAEEPDRATPLKVMSFNIRYGAAKDGDNHWKTGKTSSPKPFASLILISLVFKNASTSRVSFSAKNFPVTPFTGLAARTEVNPVNSFQ